MLFGEGAVVEYDHHPALWLRPYDEPAGDFDPPQNSPEHITARTKADHKAKTTGRKGEQKSTSYGSDAHERAKMIRLEAARAALLEVEQRTAGPKWKPKRKIPSRPFPSRMKKR